MELQELKQYDVVYLCGGDTQYLLERVNATGFNKTLLEYIQADGMVIGVSAGSLIFSNNLPGNLGMLATHLEVHCPQGEKEGKVAYPLKNRLRLSDNCALVIQHMGVEVEIIGE